MRSGEIQRQRGVLLRCPLGPVALRLRRWCRAFALIPAVAAGTSVATITASGRTTRPSAWGTIARGHRARRPDRLRERHIDGQNHHLPEGSGAGAFAADFFFVAKAQMDDAPLAAVHRVEVEGAAG